MKTQVYCGPREDVPKGYKRRGSMMECSRRRGGVTYYGIKKLDSKLASIAQKPKKRELSAAQIFVKIAGLQGLISKIKGDYPYEKDADKKAEMKEKYNEAREKMKALKVQYRERAAYEKGLVKTKKKSTNQYIKEAEEEHKRVEQLKKDKEAASKAKKALAAARKIEKEEAKKKAAENRAKRESIKASKKTTKKAPVTKHTVVKRSTKKTTKKTSKRK
jgi:hypothetical protein